MLFANFVNVFLHRVPRLLTHNYGDVLQTLGLGGMIATLLADAPAEGVAGVAIALLGCFSGALNGEVHANPIAALAFVPLTLGGLLLGRVLPRGERQGLGRFIGYTAL